MKDKSKLVLSINKKSDIDFIDESVKYINLDIMNPNMDIIEYFTLNGYKYSYSDFIDNHHGYIYVDYDTFIKGQKIIINIINNLKEGFNELEKAKYLYIVLGKMIGYDINILPEKNETFNLGRLNTINSLWGSILNGQGTNSSFCKLYLYLCRLVNLDCEIVMVNDHGYLCNKLVIGNQTIIVDLTKDIPFVQSGFRTRYFGVYNDDIELDKKIGYITNNYKEVDIDKNLKNIDYSKEDFLIELLQKTENILNIAKIRPIELGIIYDYIFHKYCPNYLININNLYINDIYKMKEHFILISYGDKHYSYNYNMNMFMEVNSNDILKNIEEGKVGLYRNEEITNLETRGKRAFN